MTPEAGFQAGFGDELFSLPPPDLACYAYPMVNRQDSPHSPGSPEIARHQLRAEIIFVGTKLALEPSRPKTTTHGRICSSQLYLSAWQIEPIPTIRRLQSLPFRRLAVATLFAVIAIFLPYSPILAADQPVWAKHAVPIGGCDIKVPSPNHKLLAEVICRNKAKEGDIDRFLRVTDGAGRKYDLIFEDNLDSDLGHKRGEELLWSPNSNEFLINGGETAISGFFVDVYQIGPKEVEKFDVTEAAQKDMVRSFPPCKATILDERECHEIKNDPDYNMSAVAWVPEKSAIIVMAEIPCSSSYGGIMCQVLGYEIQVPSGKILQRLTAKELKEKWQHDIGWRMSIPSPPDYKPPKSK